MTDVHIVYGYEQYEMPFDPIKCFARKEDAETFMAACVEHDTHKPEWPEQETDWHMNRYYKKFKRWEDTAPYAPNSRFAGYAICTMKIYPKATP